MDLVGTWGGGDVLKVCMKFCVKISVKTFRKELGRSAVGPTEEQSERIVDDD